MHDKRLIAAIFHQLMSMSPVSSSGFWELANILSHNCPVPFSIGIHERGLGGERGPRQQREQERKAAVHFTAMLFHRATLGGRRVFRDSMFW